MKKLLPILLGLSFLALPLGWFLPDEKMIAYCVCGGALLVMLCCIIYALFSKEQFSRLAENMLVVAVLIIAIVLLPLILVMILSAYLVLLSYLIIDNAKAIYRFFIPWIIGISFLALPMSFILSTSMVVTIAIWAIALVAIIVSGSHYIKALKPYWEQENKSSYVTYSIFIISFFLGMAVFVTFFNGFISFGCWWLSLIFIFFGGLITSLVILAVALLGIAITMLVKYLLKKYK